MFNVARIFAGHEILIFQVHSPSEIPNVIAVRGINRHVGTTFITANLALTLAQRGAQTLLLDLNLWNCDLTRSFGFEPTSALIDLAQEMDAGNVLSIDSIARYTKSCRPTLDLLPGTLRWLETPTLRGENGWNLIHNFFVRAPERWNTVIVDLGSHAPSAAQRDITFLISSAVHASVLQAASFLIGVCDSTAYFKIWQAAPTQDSHFRDRSIYVVNKHSSTLPLGLDRYMVDAKTRAQSFFIPSLQENMLADERGLLFAERNSQSDSLSGEQRQARRAFQDIAARVNRPSTSQEVTDRFAKSFRNNNS